jgi:hypothetical protein
MILHLHPLQPFVKVRQNLILPSVQEQDFSCKRRLSSRRADWTLHIIYDVVNQKYLLRQHEKNGGHKKNRAAYDLVCAGILKAKSAAGCSVTSLNRSISSIQSFSTPGLTHTVSYHLTDGKDATCTCQARRTNHVCWHIIKCLLLAGASEDQLLKRLGIYWGSKYGGYSTLHASMASATAAASALALTITMQHPLTDGDCSLRDVTALAASKGPQLADAGPPAAQQAAVDGISRVQNCASSNSASPSASCVSQRVATREMALAAVDRLRDASVCWPENSENWQRLYFHAEQALVNVQKGIAQASIPVRGGSSTVLLSNPKAPEGNGLKRLPDFLEGKRVKKKAIKADSSRSSACAAAGRDGAACLENAPHFLLPERRAKTSVHAEMKAKAEMERQAAAAAMRLQSGAASSSQTLDPCMPVIPAPNHLAVKSNPSGYLGNAMAVFQQAAAVALMKQLTSIGQGERYCSEPLKVSASSQPAFPEKGSPENQCAKQAGALAKTVSTSTTLPMLSRQDDEELAAALKVTSAAAAAAAAALSDSCHRRRERKAGQRQIYVPARLRD